VVVTGHFDSVPRQTFEVTKPGRFPAYRSPPGYPGLITRTCTWPSSARGRWRCPRRSHVG
jgi:hypothetical protein